MNNPKFVVEKIDEKYGIYIGEIPNVAYDSRKHLLVDRPAPNKSCFYDIEKSIWNFDIVCPSSIKRRRLNICNKCENYNTTTKICKICKCLMPVKTSFSNFSCPDKKW